MRGCMEKKRKSSQAHIDANRRYMEKTYKSLQVKVKPTDYNVIDDFCSKMDISKARFIVCACNYFIQRGELPPLDKTDKP